MNGERNCHAVLTEKDVRDIREFFNSCEKREFISKNNNIKRTHYFKDGKRVTMASIARKYGISANALSRANSGASWGCVGDRLKINISTTDLKNDVFDTVTSEELSGWEDKKPVPKSFLGHIWHMIKNIKL